MLDAIQEGGHNIDNVTVVRNGFLVADYYAYPFNKDEMHIIHSCTKSINSALIGIAIQNGQITGVDQPILDLFPDRTVANRDATKEALTLKHLLTMSAGLLCQDSYLYNWRGLDEMRASDDWAQYVLDLPMAEPPGSRFEYCNGASYLLAAILQQATGATALTYAHEHLFGPLGITEVEWPASPQGVNKGWGEMRLKPHDMAKIGLLYLNEGRWEEKQVVPADWVKASTTEQIASGTLSDSYGYQWWVDAEGYFMALGFAGQFIYVVPQRSMVVVFTSGLRGDAFFVPEGLLNDYILPAARSSDPLPPNPVGVARLKASTQAAADPTPNAVAPLTETAHFVSGRTYVFEPNSLAFKRFSLNFQEGQPALFKLSFREKNIEVQAGLDGVFRLTHSEGYLRAYKGSWITEDTFRLSYEVVGYSENGTLEIQFEPEQATVQFNAGTTGTSMTMTARFEE
jgi:CubicO group peptidase (beta-lactamase class C family)